MFLLLTDFTTYLYSEKGLAIASVEAYRRDLHFFLTFLKEAQVHDANQLQDTHLVSYLVHLQSKKYESSTIARKVFALKVFFRFLIREKKMTAHMLLFLESPKIWQLIPEVLSFQEIEMLLTSMEDQTFINVRNYAIIEVLYGCGLRVSELCALNVNDVDDQFVKVFGKGGKERIVPIGKKAIFALDRYLGLRNDEHKALFLNNRKERIDRILVWRMVKECAQKAGIIKPISPHTFRHTFATHLLDGGADLRYIQEMLGHATIASTERYTHVNATQLREAFLRFHPRL